jgi:hypothetical protein
MIGKSKVSLRRTLVSPTFGSYCYSEADTH